MQSAIDKQREQIKNFKAELEKKTIRKFQYGKATEEDSFNVKNLLQRNASNHVQRNKKAFFVAKNPSFKEASGRESALSGAAGLKEREKAEV